MYLSSLVTLAQSNAELGPVSLGEPTCGAGCPSEFAASLEAARETTRMLREKRQTHAAGVAW